jgi:hypothetical protein
MKTALVCVVCALGAFAGMHFYLSDQGGAAPEAPAEAPHKEAAAPPARFPQDLAPAARGEAVPRAAAFNASSETHPCAVLNRNGKLHEWHQRLQPDWQADSVETTELVIVVGTQLKTLLQIQTYPNGAPPVRRYRYDLDVWLVEAKTGKTIASKRFTSIARPIMPRELWELTELGDPVDWSTVSSWVREQAGNQAQDHVAVN